MRTFPILTTTQGENFPESLSKAMALETKIQNFSKQELVQFLKEFTKNQKICGVAHEYSNRASNVVYHSTENCPNNRYNLSCLHHKYTGLSAAIARAATIVDKREIANRWFDFLERLGRIDIATRVNTQEITIELQKNIHPEIEKFLTEVINLLENA